MRAVAALLPLFVLALRPAAAASDCAPLPQGGAAPAPGVTIGRFDIVRHDIFDAGDEALAWPYRLANRLHPVTREAVIRRELLIGPGDCPDGEALAQTERNLRRLGFLRDARVEVGPSEDGARDRVDVRVSTFDTWTTVPQLRFAKVGNRWVWTAGLSERNLFGRGQRVEVLRRSDIDRDETSFAFHDPRIAGSRVQAFASFGARSDGHRTELEVGRPFFALTTRWSFQARLESFDQVDPLYGSGERVSDLPHAARWLDLVGARAVARTGAGAVRLHVAYRHRRDEVGGDRRRFGIAEAGVSLLEHRFLKLTHVNRFEGSEDFNLGHQLSAALGVSTPALGGEAGTAVFASVADRIGVPLGPSRFVLAEASWAGRRRHGRWENAIGEVQLDGFARLARRAVALTRMQYRHGTNLDPEVQLTLGAQNGLRGYPVRQWVGTRSLLLAAESRLFVADDVRQLASFGVAAFVDAGYAWPDGRPVALRDLRGNLGLALLVGRNRLTTSRRAARFDLTYALAPVAGRSRWLFSAGLEAGFLN
jgi:hypothetical protein